MSRRAVARDDHAPDVCASGDGIELEAQGRIVKFNRAGVDEALAPEFPARTSYSAARISD